MKRIKTPLARTAVTALACLLLVACGKNADQANRSAASTSTTATTPATTAAPSTSQATSTTVPTAYGQLAAFITSAKQFDVQLKTAARLINGSGPPWHSITPAVAAAVKAADPEHLATSLPAGLPPALLQKTLIVYSELLSRRYAMDDFDVAYAIPEVAFQEFQQRFLDALPHGHAAAVRFAGDLAELERAARATPSFAVQSATSRAQADLLLIERFVFINEGACDGRGGTIIDTVPTIVWRSGETPDGQHQDGTIHGIPFVANLVGGTWQVMLLVC